jgi:hypothetical protein
LPRYGGATEGTIPDDGGELAKEPEILRCLSEDLESAGLAGENNTALIIFLAATSRLFPSPLSVAVKGPSSGGKTYTVQSALRFLPPEACFTLSSASERAHGEGIRQVLSGWRGDGDLPSPAQCPNSASMSRRL